LLCGTRSRTLAIVLSERVHVLPVDVPRRNAAAEAPGEGAEGSFEPEPAHQAGGPDVDRDDVERALDLVQAHIVDPDDLAPLDVDDLLVQQVALEQDLVGALAELAHVDREDAQLRAARVHVRDRRPGQEDPAPVGDDDQAGHGRVAVADRDDQVGNLADRLARRIADGPADALAQEEHGHLGGGTVPPLGGRGPGALRAGTAPLNGRGGPRGGCRRSARRRDLVRSPLGERSSVRIWMPGRTRPRDGGGRSGEAAGV
jgi:hypothetical protein